MRVRAVIFDFDLTLADSSAAIIECTEYALHQLGAAGATPAQIGAVIGLTLPQMFRALTGETEPARADAFAQQHGGQDGNEQRKDIQAGGDLGEVQKRHRAEIEHHRADQ